MINTARFGFSRASYFYTGEPTPNTPAASVPSFLVGRPVGAVVIGGSAASNPAAQLSLAGSNNGSNLDIARNLFTYEDRVTITKGRHRVSVGAWFQRLESNENLALSQYGQATFTSLTTFLEGTVGTFLFDPTPTRLGWRSLLGAWYLEDDIRLSPKLNLSLGFRDEFTNGWNEAQRSGRQLRFQQWGHCYSTASGKLGLHFQQREVPAPTANRFSVESLPHQDRRPRRLRDVQRSSRCAWIPPRSECALQSNRQHREPPGLSSPLQPRRPTAVKCEGGARGGSTRFEDADPRVLFPQD